MSSFLEIYDLIETALPEGGGWNQQTESFRQAYQFFSGEESRLKPEAE